MEIVETDDTSKMSDERQQKFTCEICTESAILSQKFDHGTDSVHNICFMCIGRYIKSKIDENIITIKCPQLECGKALTPLECRPIIPSALFVKWSDALCRSYVLTYENCSCPYRNCSELILNECNKATSKCACPRCKRLICYKCRVPWHAGFRCSERSQLERDRNDVRFDRLVKKMKWTRCPGCGQSIERVGGCCNVVCRCSTKYCHHCGSQGGCSHYADDDATLCPLIVTMFPICITLLIFMFFAAILLYLVIGLYRALS